MAQASFSKNANTYQMLAQSAVSVDDIRQLACGRAGVFRDQLAAGTSSSIFMVDTNKYVCPKPAGITLLDGCRAYWDRSAATVTYRTVNDRDFFLGTIDGDAESADTNCLVNFGVEPVYETDLLGSRSRSQGSWICEATNGLGVTLLPGGGVQLYFDAVAEAAQAAIYSERTFPITANAILEGRFALFDKGDNTALDINFGLASASHATDFQSVAEQVTFHFNGNALDLFAESDDGTTDVSETDTTIDVVDDTWFEVWIDTRVPTAVKLYVNAVRVLSGTTFTLGGASGPLFPIIHMEKTSDDTSADFRCDFLRVRTAEQ